MDRSIDAIATELVRLYRLRERNLAYYREKGGIDPAGFPVLFRLLCDGPMRSGALAEAVHSDASTVSRQVAALVERGLIERAADPADGRATVLTVTESGREVAEQIRRRRYESVAAVTGEWPETDRADFARLLARFVTDFERVKSVRLDRVSGKDPVRESNS
ncbi:MarR family winged helix-turn-helix transcriptional regulator [Nocardia thailandica]|uniref:MarR family winged helix-turn-helix transcriptional regulator n=1 Tax=Nocardia thailandica TaxID=257275 RepID=A0ABW6PH92_9NOCA